MARFFATEPIGVLGPVRKLKPLARLPRLCRRSYPASEIYRSAIGDRRASRSWRAWVSSSSRSSSPLSVTRISISMGADGRAEGVRTQLAVLFLATKCAPRKTT